ncbi:hypothetical protein ACFYTG_45230 [Streptomyces mirabilis]|uniref:hypothetical protein n=1 Tax=Streptomyces mirabilis TaxID=68239 RepID=UPI0036C30D39
MATRRTTSTSRRDVAAELAFLSRALKAPALLEAADRLAERATAESWTHQEYLAACLQREVVAREASRTVLSSSRAMTNASSSPVPPAAT